MILVSLLGTSPGTVHTTLCKLVEHNVGIDKVLIYATIEAVADEAVVILRECPCPSTGNPPARAIDVEVRMLGFEDVKSVDELELLRRQLSRSLGPGTVLDVTGGRKAMSIAAALEAYHRGSAVVTTIISSVEYKRIQAANRLCDKTARAAILLVL